MIEESKLSTQRWCRRYSRMQFDIGTERMKRRPACIRSTVFTCIQVTHSNVTYVNIRKRRQSNETSQHEKSQHTKGWNSTIDACHELDRIQKEPEVSRKAFVAMIVSAARFPSSSTAGTKMSALIWKSRDWQTVARLELRNSICNPSSCCQYWLKAAQIAFTNGVLPRASGPNKMAENCEARLSKCWTTSSRTQLRGSFRVIG